MLAQIRLARRLRPEILLGASSHDLSVDDVANAGKKDNQEQLLHPDTIPDDAGHAYEKTLLVEVSVGHAGSVAAPEAPRSPWM